MFHGPGAYVTSVGASSEIIEKYLGQEYKEGGEGGEVIGADQCYDGTGAGVEEKSVKFTAQKSISQNIDLASVKQLQVNLAGEPG